MTESDSIKPMTNLYRKFIIENLSRRDMTFIICIKEKSKELTKMDLLRKRTSHLKNISSDSGAMKPAVMKKRIFRSM